MIILFSSAIDKMKPENIKSMFILIASIIASFITCFDNFCMQRNDEIQSEKFVLHNRGNIWARQLCIFTIICIFIYDSIDGGLKIDKTFIIVSLLLSLLCDGINLITNRKMKLLWLIIYSIQSLYFIEQCIISLSLPTIASLILYFIILINTIFEVTFPQSWEQINKPSAEYTCNILNFISFSYLNKILIDPMQNKTMEISDIPTLIDADRSDYSWNKYSSNLNNYSITYNLFNG